MQPEYWINPHFLLPCCIFNNKRHSLLCKLNIIVCKILDSNLTQTSLYCSTSFDTETNTLLLNSIIDYILSTDRFEKSFFRKKALFAICNWFIMFICFVLLSFWYIIFNLFFIWFSVSGDFVFSLLCYIWYNGSIKNSCAKIIV